MRLAITSPNRGAYSETFIRTQMERLPCALRVFGRPVVSSTDPGGTVSCRSLRGLLYAAWCGMRRGFGDSSALMQGVELKRRLRQQRIDVLLANYGPAAVALQPVCAALSIPMVVHFHGYDAHLNSAVAANLTGYEQLGRRAACILVVSERMVQSLAAAGIPRSKLHLVRYGVEPTRFKEKTRFPDRPVFLGVGRFVDKKAPNLTLMAFKEVHRRLPRSRLVLVGDGMLLESTRNLASALGLGEVVVFPGAVGSDEVAQRMQEATAFVQHSLTPMTGPFAGDSEGTPVAVLEAMMSGLPVIATRHAGIGEVLEHERTGLLVQERDVRAMSEAMLRLATNDETARRMGQAARREALKHYSAQTYTDGLQRVLEAAARRDHAEVQGEGCRASICLRSNDKRLVFPGLSLNHGRSSCRLPDS